MHDSKRGLIEAIKLFGTHQELANKIGVTRQAVTQWLNREDSIPYAQAVKISAATKGQVSVCALVPSEKQANTALENLISSKNSEVIELPVNIIDIGEQRCPIFFNDPDFMKNICDELSRPILVDNHRLITCECRIRARCKLGDKTIAAQFVDPQAVISGAVTIDKWLDAFPLSERLALAFVLGKAVGDRQGQRNDLQLPDNYPEVQCKKETRDRVACLARLGSSFMFREVKRVVDSENPALIQAMDKKIISVHKAAQISRLPPAKQESILANYFKKEIKN